MPAKVAKKAAPTKKVTIAKPPAKAAKAPAKAAAKPAVKPAAAKPVAKTAASKKDIDHGEFACALMDVCKVLMGVAETSMDEDGKKFVVSTARDFSAHGSAVLKMLPEEARVPMMNMACMYMEELENDPFMFGEGFEDDYGEDDEDDEEEGGMEATLARNAIKEVDELDEDDDEDDKDDDEEGGLSDTIKEGHFLPFKEYFTKDEAKKLIASSEEGGALNKVMDAAYDSWRKAMEEADDVDEQEVDDDDADADDEDIESDDDDDEDDMKWAASLPWKDEK